MVTSEPQAGGAAAVTTAARSAPESVEMQTCVGVGWVNFDRQAQFADPPSKIPPMLRCVGSRGRFSQNLATAASSTTSTGGAAGSTARRAAAMTTATNGEQVSGDTVAIVCAGQLFMSMPSAPGRSSALQAGGSSSSSAVPLTRPIDPWAQCRLHCAGLSVRLESVEEAPAPATSSSSSRAFALQEPAEPSSADVGSQQDGDKQQRQQSAEAMLLKSAKRLEVVTGRVNTILTGIAGSAREKGPRGYVESIGSTAGKICSQAVKIVNRSGEQVGRLANASWSHAMGHGAEQEVGRGDSPGGARGGSGSGSGGL
eukprot:TRINITY_DN91036_c0_g1_i1.p1 TRINITY_DN91036_c0_g1~~TRINITY_DN91036_c0_g1_i1.p1  ORF type:complete len:313 (+),score=68.92 TRINITY_DN91036_c0_g1_i1:79-1017(+)